METPGASEIQVPRPHPRDARLWPNGGTSHVYLSRMVLVFAPEVPTILPGFVKTPRNLECAVWVRAASLERERGESFQACSICVRGPGRRAQLGALTEQRFPRGPPPSPAVIPPLGGPGEGDDLPWLAEGNLTLQQAMLLQGLAHPRGTLRPVQAAMLCDAHVHFHFLPHAFPAGTTLQHFLCILHPKAVTVCALADSVGGGGAPCSFLFHS